MVKHGLFDTVLGEHIRARRKSWLASRISLNILQAGVGLGA